MNLPDASHRGDFYLQIIHTPASLCDIINVTNIVKERGIYMSEFIYQPYIKYKKVGFLLLIMGIFTCALLFTITVLEPFRSQLIPQALPYIQLFSVFNLVVTLFTCIFFVNKSKEALTFNRHGVTHSKAKGIVWEKDWRELRWAYRRNHPEGPEFLVLSPTPLTDDELEELIVIAAAKGKLIYKDMVICRADEETYADIRRIMDAIMLTIS